MMLMSQCNKQWYFERTGQKIFKNTDSETAGTILTIHLGSSVISTAFNTLFQMVLN